MNKYLLWVLLASSSLPAYSHVFEFEEGTATLSNTFFGQNKSWKMSGTQTTDSLGTAAWAAFSGSYSFRWRWETRTSANITNVTGRSIVQTWLPTMFNFASTNGVPSKDWADMGTYKFPLPVQKQYGSCSLPDTIEVDTIPPERYVTYTIEGAAAGTSTSNGKSGTFNMQCTGRYVIQKNVDIKLGESTINLNGSTAAQLTGSTRMFVSGFGGPVTVQIDNPNAEEVSVSFDPNHSVTSTTMDLNQQPQYEQQIYVRGNPSVPGRHEYRVNLIGAFK